MAKERRGLETETVHAERSARRRVGLGGVLLDRVDRDAAVARIRGFLRAGGLHQIVTVNLDFVAIARRDAYFRGTLNAAELAVADGMPLVWLSRLGGAPLPGRVTGVELVDECCRVATEDGAGVFLLGAAPGVADKAAAALRARFPSLRVAGVYAPPFGPLTLGENDRILRHIEAARPGFLFVALGAPQQDVWIRANRDRLDVPVAMGVGGTLDLLAGRVSRAPAWMQRGGLEWLFRLAQEPGRLWRRYLLDDVPTLLWLARRLARSRQNAPRPPRTAGTVRSRMRKSRLDVLLYVSLGLRVVGAAASSVSCRSHSARQRFPSNPCPRGSGGPE